MKKRNIPATTLLVGTAATLVFCIGLVHSLINSERENNSSAQVQQSQSKTGLAAYTLSGCRRMLNQGLS